MLKLTERINRIMNEVTSGVLSAHFPIIEEIAKLVSLKVLKPGAKLSRSIMGLHRYYDDLFQLEGNVSGR